MDAMLSLSRAIIAKPNTSPQNDTTVKKLISFIKDWSKLQLAWRNWYNELHANLEQSKNLSDQLNTFGHGIKGVYPHVPSHNCHGNTGCRASGTAGQLQILVW